MQQTNNTQILLFVISILLALGIGFYMGSSTGYLKGSDDMHAMMHESEDSDAAMEEHMKGMMDHASPSTSAVPTTQTGVKGAIDQMNHLQ